jgi:hypothetical protein
MSKPPEVVEVAGDDTLLTIVTYLYDLETWLISAYDKSVPPSRESASIEPIFYDSALRFS